MIQQLREQFNGSFSKEKYAAFLKELEEYAGEKIPFRIAETPVFVPASLHKKLDAACESIIDVIRRPGFSQLTKKSIPQKLFVPCDEGNPLWMAFDFGICRDASGELTPMLIEMQGFASLFYYQHVLAQAYLKHFDVGDGVSHIFGKGDTE